MFYGASKFNGDLSKWDVADGAPLGSNNNNNMVRGARPHSSTVALCRHTDWPPRAACASVHERRLHDGQLRLELAGDEEHQRCTTV